MATPLALIWDLIAHDNASPTFNRVAVSADRAAASTERASASTSLFGKKMLAAFGGLAAIDLGVHLVKGAADFQKQMTLIQTQAGASAREVQSMSKAVLGLAGPLGTAPIELAKSLYLVESAGYRGGAAIKVLTAAAKEAKIGNADLTQTTDALVGVMQTGIVGGANNASKAVAQLNAIVGSGKMTFDDLNGAISTGIVASAKQFGISLKSVGAALALMTDQGVPAQQAATRLRMAMSLLGAPTKQAAGILTTLGVSSADAGKQASQMADLLKQAGVQTLTLATDLRKPDGFLVAVQDLKDHLVAAGLSAPEAAAAISRAFGGGRSSGPILQMLSNLDLLKQKFENETQIASKWGLAWHATVGTTSFAFSRLVGYAEAGGVALGEKLLPAVTEAANWLGTNLPRAVSTIWQAIRPLVQEVGGALTTAWRVLAPLLRLVATDLGSLGHVLANNASTVRNVATAVAFMWAAWKGYTIVAVAVTAMKTVGGISGIMETLALRTMYAGDAMRGFAASGAGFTTLVAGFGVAAYAAGRAINSWAESNNLTAHTIDNLTQVEQTFAQALDATNGKITDQIRKTVGMQLETSGLADRFKGTGVSLAQLEQAVIGSRSAFASLLAPLQKSGKLSGDTAVALALLHNKFSLAATQTRAVAASLGAHAAAAKTDAGAVDSVSRSSIAATNALKLQAQSIKDATTALFNFITAELSAKNAQLGFQAGLLGLTANIKQTGTSLDNSTVKGNANRQMLVGLLQSAEAAAQGSKHQTQAMIDNVKALEEHAVKAGFDKGKVDDLIRSLKLTPKDIRSQINVDTSQADAAIRRTRYAIESLSSITIGIHASATVQGRQVFAGGGAAQGPGTATSDSIFARLSNGEHVWTADEVVKAGGQGAMYRARQMVRNGMLRFAGGGAVGGNESIIWRFLRSHGLRALVAAGFMGNFDVETGGTFSPTAYNPREGAIGIAQWEGSRRTALQAFAARRGTSETNLMTQLEFFWQELHHGYGNVLRSAAGMRSARGVAALVDAQYERSSGDARGQRMADAASIFAAARGGSLGSSFGGGAAGGGGGVGPITAVGHGKNKEWVYNGIRYASRMAAQNAQTRDRQNVNYKVDGQSYSTMREAVHAANQAWKQRDRLVLKIDDKDLKEFRRSLSKTASDVRQSLGQVFADAHQAGVSGAFIKGLRDQESRLLDRVRARNRIADQLAKVMQRMASLASGVRSGVQGFFDVTSAGQNPVTQQVTGGSLLAQQTQALNQIRKYSHLIRALENRHLDKRYLMQLASQGPSVIPQLEALLSLNNTQFSRFNAQERDITHTARSLGRNVSRDVYGNRAHDLRQREHEENRLVEKLGSRLGHELREAVRDVAHEPIEVKVNGQTLLKVVRHEERKAARHGGVS